jgi:hypothetical protein
LSSHARTQLTRSAFSAYALGIEGNAPRLVLMVVALGAALASARCSLLAPSDDELLGGARPVDSRDAADVGPDAADGTPAVFHEMTSPEFWSVFDIASTFPVAREFMGGTFDGRYVYFSPYASGVVARYDTQDVFAAASSWSVFDTKALGADVDLFGGAVFDGRYVYFVPRGKEFGYARDAVVRYDPQGPFGARSAWATFHATTVNAGASNFGGAVFDGRYLYFAPHQMRVVVRYDTRANFGAPSAWAALDVAAISPNAGAGAFQGGVFDGRYVYLIQNQNTGVGAGGMITRYDTQAAFAATSSWAFFDLKGVNAAAVEFFGGAFDGRYVYAVPGRVGSPSFLARLDAQGSFTASWSIFDVTTIRRDLSGFGGAAFDGRYVYLVPHDNGAPSGIVARTDTTAVDFKDKSAWSTYDTSSLSADARGFSGAVFDGRYLYFVPKRGAVAARFDAKNPPAMPRLPAFSGSFL